MKRALELLCHNANPPDIAQGDGVMTRSRCREELEDYQAFSKKLDTAQRLIGAAIRRDFPLSNWRSGICHLRADINHGEKWEFGTMCTMEMLLKIFITIWSNNRL